MLSLSQRLIIGCVSLLLIVIGLGLSTRSMLREVSTLDAQVESAERSQHDALAAAAARHRDVLMQRAAVRSAFWLVIAIAIFAVMIPSVLLPIRSVARGARAIAQGDLHQRIEYRARDDLGAIAIEINRMAVRLRDLLETESGRRQMEHQLSNAVLQSIFEPVIVTDAKGHVLKLNEASSELLGDAATDRMALTTTPGGERILSAVRDAVSMQRAVATEGDASILPLRIGKAQRCYRLRTTPIRDDEGKLLGVVTVLEDVTELQNLDRFKTRFLSIASQKLRDPLHRLRLSIYSIAKGFAGELRPLQRDLIEGAEDEAQRLDDLMADLIEVAELDVGNRQPYIEKVRPIDALNDACHRIQPEVRKRDIDVQIKAFADLSYVNADRRALRSILDNLLNNAVRYTPHGGEIWLTAVEVKDKIQFSVRDNGRGIEAERLPGLFGRFNQGANGDQSSDNTGTGLGLALVRRLVESLGGQISVESRLGSGTSFHFTLPVATLTDSRHPVEIG
jgi:signal transduction histidine kinase/HAMP domain-containing protein